MFNNIIQGLWPFRWYLAATVLITVLVCAVIQVAGRRLDLTRACNRHLFGFFIGMRPRHILWTGAAVCQFIYILVLTLPLQTVSLNFLWPLAVLAVLRFALRPRAAALLDVLNALLMYAALFLLSTMYEYVLAVRFDLAMLIVCIVMALTIVHYSFYTLISDLLYVTRERGKPLDEHSGKRKDDHRTAAEG